MMLKFSLGAHQRNVSDSEGHPVYILVLFQRRGSLLRFSFVSNDGEAYPAHMYIQRIEHHSHSPGVMELNVEQLAHRQLVAWSGRSYGCKSETRR